MQVYSGRAFIWAFKNCPRSTNFRKFSYMISLLSFEKHVLKPCFSSSFRGFCSGNTQEETPSILQPVSKSSSTLLRIKTMSRAMKEYLERAKNHEEFVKSKTAEYEIGKKHLANMMGLDADSLTQEDIDKAIEYLLPSGIFERKARPIMKRPEVLYPKQKAAQFDISGRPISPFFYTLKPNYYEAMHELICKFHELDEFEDKMIRLGISEPPEESRLALTGGDWLTVDQVRDLFIEKITAEQYDFVINTLTRLASHPYSFRVKDHIWKFRKDFESEAFIQDVPDLKYDDNGRPYIEADGVRKATNAHVIVWGSGTGKININGNNILYFSNLQDRQQIMFPLELTELLGKVDVYATVEVEGKGTSGMSGAIRHGLSLCLRSFVTLEVRERMRLAGLLTKDRRRRERKKYGQKGARAKFTWKKR